ncbi:MAG: MarR family transcriptional regulator [Eubacterium sp.]|nr:MarR family transcriptional regulator [Eubacterium sp.]
MSITNQLQTADDPYAAIRLDNQICFPLYACSKELIRQYRPSLDKLNLTYTQYLVMMVLWEHGSMIEKELGERVHLASGTLAPLLKRMESQGLVRRKRTPADERTLQVDLTPSGEALKEKALAVPLEMGGCLNITDDEAAFLYKILYKALASMENRGL